MSLSEAEGSQPQVRRVRLRSASRFLRLNGFGRRDRCEGFVALGVRAVLTASQECRLNPVFASSDIRYI
ncbi:MAG: hypothetical protein KME26_00695 [Oscillatoria princeps RMCB-10]|nr:hypothetical protein [Oscillatoria princeps RMCB-10]